MSATRNSTSVKLQVGNDVYSYVVPNKAALTAVQFDVAMRHWKSRMGANTIPPKSRDAVIEKFYKASGNSCTTRETQLLSEAAISQMLKRGVETHKRLTTSSKTTASR
jgi:hypothetical protein